MQSMPGEDGSGEFLIHREDRGGWIRVFPDAATYPSDTLPTYLSKGLTDWFRERPQFRMRCVVSIQRDGNTAELHAWYDQVLFPPLDEPDAP